MDPVMTWTPLLSPLWGLSAWLAPENGEQCDQSEASIEGLDQSEAWRNADQARAKLMKDSPSSILTMILNWRQKIVLMLYWAPGDGPTWQFSDRMNMILDFNLTTNKSCLKDIQL